MKFIHYNFHLNMSDIIEVSLTSQANVRLLDDINFHKYRRGESYKFNGGRALRTPIRISPPHSGHWNLVIDLQGFRGQVNASVKIVS